MKAHYTYLQEDYGRSLGIAETALALQSEIYPIPTIYLHLVAVMNYMSLKRPDKAKEHLLSALEAITKGWSLKTSLAAETGLI